MLDNREKMLRVAAEERISPRIDKLAGNSAVQSEARSKRRSWPLYAAIAGQAAATRMVVLTFWRNQFIGSPALVGILGSRRRSSSAACKSLWNRSMRWMIGAPVASVVIFVLAFFISTAGIRLSREIHSMRADGSWCIVLFGW